MKHTFFFTLSCKLWRLTVGSVKAVLSGPTAWRGRQPQGLLAPLLMYQQADITGPRDVPSGRASTHFLGKWREKRDSGTKQRCHARLLYSSFLRLPTHPSSSSASQPPSKAEISFSHHRALLFSCEVTRGRTPASHHGSGWVPCVEGHPFGAA